MNALRLFDDPLVGMLAALPVAAALHLLARRLLEPRRRVAPTGFAIALGIAWIAAALLHARAGLDGSALAVAAAGFGLAAYATAALVPALVAGARRAEAPHRATLAAFLAALAFLLFLWPWNRAGRAPDGDEPYFLLLTASLAEDFDVDLANQYRDRAWERFGGAPLEPQPGDPVGANGERWSRHGAFLPLLLAPLHRLAGPAGAEAGMLFVAAAVAAAAFALARRRLPESPRAAALAWAVVTLAPPLALYAGRLWVELPAALAFAVALTALPAAHGEPIGRRRATALAVALVALPLLKLRFLALALPLLAFALVRLPGRRRLRVALAAIFLAALGALALSNALRFGNPLRMYVAGDLAPSTLAPTAIARGLAGFGFDVAYGLFATSPIWLLLFATLALVAARRRLVPTPFAGIAEAAAALPYLAILAARREWYGGWSPPFRYGVVLLPLAALLVAGRVAARPRGAALRVTVALLGGATALAALVFLLHPAWTFSLADGGSRPLAELSDLYRGDLVRFTPSVVRPRAATRIWVLAAPILVLVAAHLRRRRAPGLSPGAAAALGATLLVSLFAGWLALARTVPTRVVELEDRWVDKRGGGLFPGPWTIDRTRFDGGWILARDAAATFVPVAGGDRATLHVRAMYFGETAAGPRLALRVGGTGGSSEPFASFGPPAEREQWVELTAPAVDLPVGASVSVLTNASPEGSPGNFWVVDRVELDWR